MEPLRDRDAQTPQPESRTILWTVMVLGIVVLVCGAWFGYTRWSQGQNALETEAQLYKGKISIGYTVWPGYAGLYVAETKGYFKDLGLDVDVVAYPSFQALSAAYVAGEIQGKANLTLDAVDEAYRGLDHKVVLVIDHSNGSDGIIASRAIKSFADVKGKRVGYEYGTLEEFFIRYALEQNNLTLEDIRPFNLDAEHAVAALVEGKVDVAVTYEPFLSQTIATIQANKIYSSADAPGLITDVLTFRTDFVRENPETIDAIVHAYFKGLGFLKANPTEAHAIVGKAIDAPAVDIGTQLQGIDVLDARDNRTSFTFAAGFESLYGNMRRVGDFIRQEHYPNATKFDTDTLVDDRFIKKLAI